MAQPTPYDRLYSFTDFQTTNPTKPLPATELDAELNAIELTTDQIRQKLAQIQRDDGKLANQTVTPESLSAGTLALINQGGYNPRGPWVTATAYAVDDVVDYNLATYLCLTAHTSAAAFDTDLTANRWLLIANAALSGEENALDKFIGNGVQTAFTLSLNYQGDEAVAAYVNGVLQVPGQAYTVSGTTITFVVPPPAPAVPGNFNVVVRGNAVTAQALTDAAVQAAQAALASEQAADLSADQAASSALAAANTLDAFDDRYLGAKANDPALDNDGNALLTGALYWNTTLNQMRVYSGTQWTSLPVTSSQFSQTFSGTGAQTNFTLANASGPAVNLEVFISGVRQIPTTNYTVSNNILTFVTAPPAGTNNIFVRYAQLLQEVSTAAFTLQEVTPSEGQTVVTVNNIYVPGSNNLEVYLNGLRQSPGDDYAETSSTSITFTSALASTDKVLLVVGGTINESVGAQQVGYTPAGTGAVPRNVQAKLREWVSLADFNVPGGGVSDATTTLQQALTASSSALTPLYVTKATSYLLTAPVSIPNGTTVDLNGATVILGFSGTSAAIVCGANVTVQNGTIQVPAGFTQDRIISTGAHNRLRNLLVTSVDQQNNRSDNQDAAVRILGNDCWIEAVRVVNFDNAFSMDGADLCTLVSVRCTSYVRGLYVNDCDYCDVKGFLAETRSPNATATPGHNGILISQTRWSSFSDLQIFNAGEHGIRIGGSVTHGSQDLTFSNIHVEKPNQCGFKIRDEANRTRDIQITGFFVVDCSFGGGASSNEDGLRIEKADNVMVTGLNVNVRDGGTSAFDGIHIYDSTDVTIVAPRIEDVARDGIRITDSDGAAETGVVNSIHIVSPQIIQTAGNGVTISSPTQTLRDIYVTNVSIRQQTGFGVQLTASSITQPVQITGIVNREGSGIFSTNNNDSQIHVDLKIAEQTSALNELTIASGAVTLPTRQAVGFYYLDTEGDAATDDLDTLNGGATYGQIVVLSPINDARTVVVKDGTGNMRLEGDFSMDNSQDTITLAYNGSTWYEIARSNNAA